MTIKLIEVGKHLLGGAIDHDAVPDHDPSSCFASDKSSPEPNHGARTANEQQT
jgi:hypothetical protein